MQAVCNAQYHFTVVWIQNLASASDFIAFSTLDLYQMLKSEGFLATGLALFGDNAYIANEFMVTSYMFVTSPVHKGFNFFQSQLHIVIEQAFSILVHRWGILWHPLLKQIWDEETDKYCDGTL